MRPLDRSPGCRKRALVQAVTKPGLVVEGQDGVCQPTCPRRNAAERLRGNDSRKGVGTELWKEIEQLGLWCSMAAPGKWSRICEKENKGREKNA